MIAVRRREKSKYTTRPPPGRHSRFGGTYVLANIKSVSDKDIICHQSLSRAIAMDFDREKTNQKRSHRIVKENEKLERRSAFSVRLIDFAQFYTSTKHSILSFIFYFYALNTCQPH